MKKISIYLSCFVLFFNLAFNIALAQNIVVNTLPSGQRVIIKEIKDNPIVKIDTWINTGSINEDETNSGLSHFLEHLFFKGTTKYPTGKADEILDSKGAIVNAGTSKDFTHYYIEIPSKDFDLALDIHSDMLLNPMIPRKELERERPVVIEEISKCKDSPSNLLFDNLYELLYAQSNHPYKRNVIGKKEIIENVSREEILSYYNKFYTPDAYLTVIVGDVDSQEALKKVEEAFKNNNKNVKQTKVNYPKIKPLTKVEKRIDTMDINKTYMMFGWHAPKFASFKDNYALDVLSNVLSTGRSSILNQDLKEQKQLVLSVSSGNYSQKDSGLFYIDLTLEPSKENEIAPNVLNEIKKIQKGEFSEKIIEKAKNQIKTDTYYARESISNISEEIGYMFTFSPDNSYYDNYLKNIDKVTKQDIINVAKKYLNTDKYALSIVRPNNYKPVNNIENKEVMGEYKLIEENGNAKKVKLDNGITLITKKKNSNNIVAMDISIKGVRFYEKKPLAALIASSLALKGSENYSNIKLSELLDESGIKLSCTSGLDDYSIFVQSTNNQIEKVYHVLDEIINKPLFLESEMEKIVSRKKQELKALPDNPSSYVFDTFRGLAYPNEIYGQNSKFILDNIDKVTRDDIKSFYKEMFNPNNIVVTVVGDVSINDVAKNLSLIFPKRNDDKKFEYSNYKYNKYRLSKNIEKDLYKNETQTQWLVLGYKTTGVLDNRKDVATLNIINSILGSGMSSRLFRSLREEKGLAYTVGSTVDTNFLDGAFICYIGTKLGTEKEAKQGIADEIERLKKEMVTTKELNDAKDKIMGKLLLNLETNMDEAELYSYYGIIGRDLNAFEEYKNLIKSINQNDIIEVSNKYFSNPYIYVVIKKK